MLTRSWNSIILEQVEVDYKFASCHIKYKNYKDGFYQTNTLFSNGHCSWSRKKAIVSVIVKMYVHIIVKEWLIVGAYHPIGNYLQLACYIRLINLQGLWIGLRFQRKIRIFITPKPYIQWISTLIKKLYNHVAIVSQL